MLEEEEEEEEEDELLEDELQEDGDEEQEDGMDLEDMLAEELDGEGDEGDEADEGEDADDDGGEGDEDGDEDGDEAEEVDEGDEDDDEAEEEDEEAEGDEGLLSPTTDGQTGPESGILTEGGEDGRDGAKQSDAAGAVRPAVPTQTAGEKETGLTSPSSTGAAQGGKISAVGSGKSDGMNEDGKNSKDDNDEIDDDINMGEDDDDQNLNEGGEEEDLGAAGEEPVPDVHHQFALLLADPNVPRLPNDPSIIDVSRLTIEQRKIYNAKVMSLLTEDQLDRYVCGHVVILSGQEVCLGVCWRLTPQGIRAHRRASALRPWLDALLLLFNRYSVVYPTSALCSCCRYECFRRSSLKEPMRRLVQVIVGGGMPKATDKIIVAMAGVGKVFVGELVEEARRIAEERGERGALRKETMMEAYFRVRGDGRGDGGSSRKRRKMMRL